VRSKYWDIKEFAKNVYDMSEVYFRGGFRVLHRLPEDGQNFPGIFWHTFFLLRKVFLKIPNFAIYVYLINVLYWL